MSAGRARRCPPSGWRCRWSGRCTHPGRRCRRRSARSPPPGWSVTGTRFRVPFSTALPPAKLVVIRDAGRRRRSAPGWRWARTASVLVTVKVTAPRRAGLQPGVGLLRLARREAGRDGRADACRTGPGCCGWSGRPGSVGCHRWAMAQQRVDQRVESLDRLALGPVAEVADLRQRLEGAPDRRRGLHDRRVAAGRRPSWWSWWP